jgi:hypothetical protein
MTRKRGAVVIGVCRTGGLQPLESPVTGAETVAEWLRSEGFKPVVTITDDPNDPAKKVKWQQIADAIKGFVDSGYHQLVVYFSGHGLWKNRTELWLLSDAPGDANAAVSWAETADYAQDCGIPNVVLISDACRTLPRTPQQERVRGAIVFPSDEAPPPRAKVDKFMATAEGQPAYEIAIGAGGRKSSAFTHCFLQAFTDPEPDMIRQVTEDGQTFEVVPNRRLEKYLQREVRTLMANVNVQYDQCPEIDVPSDDDVYIGRARVDAARGKYKTPDFAPPGTGEPVVQMRDVAALAVRRAMNLQPQFSAQEANAIDELARTSGFNDAVDQAGMTAPVRHFESETGFAVIGTGVAAAVATNGRQAFILEPGNLRNPGFVRIGLTAPESACSVALRFTNGRGTALAAMPGYIGHIVVDGNGVTSVSYVPADNSTRWGDYEQRREQIDRLRAAAAAAARHGVFRLDDRQAATDLAGQIRVGRGLDPALGLYAAYAYAEADRRDGIETVRACLQADLSADLFDVAMLARTMTGRPPPAPQVVPFCPMLTQGWNLLRTRQITLPKELDDAQDELEQALWTTFKPARIEKILEAIKRGEIS